MAAEPSGARPRAPLVDAAASPLRPLVSAAAGTSILVLYYADTGLALTPGTWLSTFSWGPVSAEAPPGGLAAVAASSLIALTTWLAWLAVAWVAGSAVLAAMGWKAGSRSALPALEESLVAVGLGLGMVSLSYFALGALGLHGPGSVWVVGGLLLGFGVIHLRDTGIGVTLPDPVPEQVSTQSGALGGPAAAALLLAAAAAAFHLLGALLPPANFDEMNYQLALPKLYALNKGFVPTPYNHLSFLPRNMSMLYVAGLLSAGAVGAKLFSFGMGLLAAAALYVFAAGPLGRPAAALGASLFLLTPVVGNQLRVAGADLGTAFYELAALLLLFRWSQDERPGTLLLSSLFWGLALGTKYTAVPGFAGALGYAFWRMRGRRRARSPIRGESWRIELEGGADADPRAATMALLAGPALALWSPWLVKNWIDSGNPVNPILSTVIPSRNFMFAGEYLPKVDYWARLGIENYFPVSGALDLAALPWRLFTRHNDFNHDLGPMLLALLPLCLASLRARRGSALEPAGPEGGTDRAWRRTLFAFCALYWVLWFASGVRMTRYFVAGLGLTSLAAASLALSGLAPSPGAGAEGGGGPGAPPGTGRAPAWDRRWAWLALAPLLAAMVQSFMRVVSIQNDRKKPWGYLAGRTSLRDYLQATLVESPFEAFEFVNSSLPRKARVLLINEFRPFYLERDFLASTPWDHDYWHEIVRLSPGPREITARLRELRVTHLLVHDTYPAAMTGRPRLTPWTPEDLAKEQAFLAKGVRVLKRAGPVWVAKVH